MIKTHLPPEFEARLREILPEIPEGLFDPKAYQSFRINTLKITLEKAHELLKERNIAFEKAAFCDYAISVDRTHAQEILKSDLVSQGLLYSQGLQSMLPVLILDPKPGERVLDLCAAPGSKTSQMAMHMNNEGFLKANEPIRERFYRLKSVLELTGSKAQLSWIDGRRMGKIVAEVFDRILVDAPCSSEGRFNLSEPKSFAYWSIRKIKEMSHKQKGLLLNASRMLAPGGSLVYSTCTFAPEENEEVVDWFLRKTENRFEPAPITIEGVKSYPAFVHWQKDQYDARVKNTLRVFPGERMEGFFIAKFVNSHYK